MRMVSKFYAISGGPKEWMFADCVEFGREVCGREECLKGEGKAEYKGLRKERIKRAKCLHNSNFHP